MPTNLPTTIPELINWSNTHSDLWMTNAAAIGLSPAQASAFKTLVGTLVANNSAADMARQASKDATMNLGGSVAAVRTLAGAYINVIKGFAQSTENPAVYTLAGVSPNDGPSTLPPPVPPQQFSATVNADGSLTVRWKVAQPAGVTGVQYLVSRRLAGQTTFTIVSSEGANKSFTDQTLPFGVDRVDYIVQPKRGEVLGAMSAVYAVQFGSVGGGGGGLAIAGTGTAPSEGVKIAA